MIKCYIFRIFDIDKKNSSKCPEKAYFGGIAKSLAMSKVRKIAEITENIPFTEFNFYDLYRSKFENSDLGRIKKMLPLHEMAENFGLVNKSMRPKLGRRSFFTPEGKVALMLLKMYTGLSCPKPEPPHKEKQTPPPCKKEDPPEIDRKESQKQSTRPKQTRHNKRKQGVLPSLRPLHNRHHNKPQVF